MCYKSLWKHQLSRIVWTWILFSMDHEANRIWAIRTSKCLLVIGIKWSLLENASTENIVVSSEIFIKLLR